MKFRKEKMKESYKQGKLLTESNKEGIQEHFQGNFVRVHNFNKGNSFFFHLKEKRATTFFSLQTGPSSCLHLFPTQSFDQRIL